MEYLESRGITDEEIREGIFKESKGVPYYLELAIHIYLKTCDIEKRKQNPKEFGDDHRKITERFFRFLNPEEKNALNVLLVPHFWDYDPFEYLVKEFNIGYPTNNFEDLCSFSFIGKVKNNNCQMHLLMRECLQRIQENEKPESVKRIHKAINTYYSNKLKNIDIKRITLEHENAFTEAFYHANKSLEAEELLNWFINVSDPFYKIAYWQLIIPRYEEMLQILEAKLGPEHPDLTNLLTNLARLYDNIGEYEKAIPLYKRALNIREILLGPQHLAVARIPNNLAVLYKNMGEYVQALPLHQKALDIFENFLGTQHPDVANTLNDLAGLYESMGDYEKALPLHQRIEINSNHPKQ
jgi:tetratricopeptide (TPR) repeat protein